VQTKFGTKLNLSGGTMTGNIAMGSNYISFTGSAAADIAKVGYTDATDPDYFIISLPATSNDGISIQTKGTGSVELITDGTGDIVMESGGSVEIAAGDLELTDNNNVVLQDGAWVGLGAAAGNIMFTDAATDEIEIQNANINLNSNNITDLDKLDIISGGRVGISGDHARFVFTNTGLALDDVTLYKANLSINNISAEDPDTGNLQIGSDRDGTSSIDFWTNKITMQSITATNGDTLFKVQEIAVTPTNTVGLHIENRGLDSSNYVAKFYGNPAYGTAGYVMGITSRGEVQGTGSWSGTVASGAWGAATKAVALATIAAGDLVIITPNSAPVGDTYWVTKNAGVGFTVNSNNGGETMGFDWIVIKQ